MKKFFLIALILVAAKTNFAQTLAMNTPVKPFAELNAIKANPSSERTFYYRDGNNIKSYPSGNIAYVIDGNEIKSFPYGKVLYYLDGQNVKEFPAGNIRYVIDGDKVKNPSGDIMYYKEENKVKRADGKVVNNNFEDGVSPLWIIVCIINTGC
jgi:hypothetical protein